ncbi:MAG: hypothetical protein R2728_00755 [Chitinophagales bacterium]
MILLLVSVQDLNHSSFKSISIILPPMFVAKFEEIYSIPIVSKQNENVNENRHLNQLRDTLLPQLISGTIRVKALVVATVYVVTFNKYGTNAAIEWLQALGYQHQEGNSLQREQKVVIERILPFSNYLSLIFNGCAQRRPLDSFYTQHQGMDVDYRNKRFSP